MTASDQLAPLVWSDFEAAVIRVRGQMAFL